MGQKDQDVQYAEKCHFFQLRSLITPIKKKARSKVRTCSVLLLFWNKIGLGTLGGPPGGPGAKGTNQQFLLAPTDVDPLLWTRMDNVHKSVTFLSTSELNYTNLKTGPIKSKNM